MSATITTPGPLTFEEFEILPDPAFGRYELLEGSLITVPPPKKGHADIQDKVKDLLRSSLSQEWHVRTEFGFRAGPDSYLIPDVAAAGMKRWEETPDDGYFTNSPEISIEIMSPSNSAADMEQKQAICFDHGCLEFWIINPRRRTVTVHRVDGTWHTYSASEAIPLDQFGAESLPVNSIFSA